MMVFFVNITDIISLSILIKTPFFASKNLMKMIKVHQFFKNQDQFEVEMANKPVPVGITRTRPRFDGESPL